MLLFLRRRRFRTCAAAPGADACGSMARSSASDAPSSASTCGNAAASAARSPVTAQTGFSDPSASPPAPRGAASVRCRRCGQPASAASSGARAMRLPDTSKVCSAHSSPSAARQHQCGAKCGSAHAQATACSHLHAARRAARHDQCVLRCHPFHTGPQGTCSAASPAREARLELIKVLHKAVQYMKLSRAPAARRAPPGRPGGCAPG